MKVIFLDIDGVLNNELFFIQQGKGPIKFMADKMALLKEIVETAEAQIVLSSSWRLLPKEGLSYQSLVAGLEAMGLSLYGCTPSASSRAEEISLWLSEHPEVTNYVILDDETMEEPIAKHLVQTQWRGDGGLQSKHVQLALDILNKEF